MNKCICGCDEHELPCDGPCGCREYVVDNCAGWVPRGYNLFPGDSTMRGKNPYPFHSGVEMMRNV